MSDFGPGVPKPEDREPGVLYQHPLYDREYYEGLEAIEVCGVRFVREDRTADLCGLSMADAGGEAIT